MTDTKTDTTGSNNLYPIAVLIDELRAEEQKKRINAIQNINTICVALGPERTRNELLPYILELLEDDEEVLTKLAEVLGSQLNNVGGPAQADHLFKVLERLCQIEEISVREKVSNLVLPSYHMCVFVGYREHHQSFGRSPHQRLWIFYYGHDSALDARWGQCYQIHSSTPDANNFHLIFSTKSAGASPDF